MGVVFLVLACGPISSADDTPTAWQLLDDGDPPRLGAGLPFVYDSARQKAVLYLAGGAFPSSTWELVSEDWIRRVHSEPTPTGGGCTVFDEGRGVTVHFGGGNVDGPVNETWEYDGTQWARRQPAASPPARGQCALTYDSIRRRIVLHGGLGITPPGGYPPVLGDTWEYDGTDWVEVQTRDSPGERVSAAMTFDRHREVAILFGGWRYGAPVLGDTWEYDGRNWRKRNPQTSPSARYDAGVAYDRVRRRTVLFGGGTDAGYATGTWEYNGVTWAQINPPQSPVPRTGFRMDYDTVRGRVIGYGGDTDTEDFNDTWAYDGTTWTQIAISDLPRARYRFGMAYDPLLDRTVLYGGQKGTGPTPGDWLRDTWHFDGRNWVEQQAAGTPTASSGLLLAFDESLSRLVSFSGAGGGPGQSRDLHEYLGSPRQWTSSSPSPSPESRQDYGWTQAPALGGTLLFGGVACCTLEGFYYDANDTWILSGDLWEQRSPAQSPAARGGHALAFDSKRSRAILYGGRSRWGTNFSDTWVYDGVSVR